MITKDQDMALLTVGNAARSNPEWTSYSDYCLAREKGLRKEAFKHLEVFLKAATGWTMTQKIAFVEFLFGFFERVEEADHGPFPQPLSQRLVKPTLEQWCSSEREDGRPFRWYGVYFRNEDYLNKAIELNPVDDLARACRISRSKDLLYYSLHHLPEGYLGSPSEDLDLAENIRSEINKLVNNELRSQELNELEYDVALIRNYLEWEQSGHPDFAQWGDELNKFTGYGNTRTYYFEN